MILSASECPHRLTAYVRCPRIINSMLPRIVLETFCSVELLSFVIYKQTTTFVRLVFSRVAKARLLN